MRLYLTQIVGLLLAVSMISVPARGAEINMVELKDVHNSMAVGIQIEDSYYTAVIENGSLKKLELDASEAAEFVIRTDWNTVFEFASRFHEMSWLDKAAYLVNRMKVPLKYVMDLTAMGVEE